MLSYIILEMVSAVVGVIAIVLILIQVYKFQHFQKLVTRKVFLIPFVLLVIAFFSGLFANKTYSPH
ncbi:MAG: hypothetical protein KBB88_02560, partial [Candidatus Pacebacteria bacterium]|nr:hypothetical protein [Candidatus Paceibacterota bacterium]